MLPPTSSWLLLLAVTIVSATVGPRSLDLQSAIDSLTGEAANCSIQCFSSMAGSRSCDDIYQVLGSDALDCLKASCTTHEALAADQLLVEACGAAPRDYQSAIRGITWALFILTTIFVIGRLLTRSPLYGGALMGADDWAILGSYVVIIGVQAGVEIMAHFGLGRDIWTLNDTQIIVVVILFYVAEMAYVVETTITKISILLLYLRIFPDQRFRQQVYFLIIVMVLIFVTFIIGIFNYCKPFPYTWYRWDNEHHGTCVDIEAQTFTHAGLNIVLDLTIFFMPIPHLIKLDMNMKKKIGIILTFIVGLFVTICSIIRLKYLIGWAFNPNPPWNYSELAVWSVIELDVSVICACMPGMASLLRRIKQRSTEYIKSKSTNSASRRFDRTTEGEQGIVKTTIVSVLHSGRAEDGASESGIELVGRQRPDNVFFDDVSIERRV